MEDINLPVKELWFPFDIAGRAQQAAQESGQTPEIRLAFNYAYSQAMMLDWQCQEWRKQLEEDVNDYLNIEGYLVQLQSAHDFLNFRDERERKLGITFDEIGQESFERRKFKSDNTAFHKFEKDVVDKNVSKYANLAIY